MLFQQAPADTMSFMILGFSVILGSMALFILSIYVRYQNLRKDQAILDEIEE